MSRIFGRTERRDIVTFSEPLNREDSRKRNADMVL